MTTSAGDDRPGTYPIDVQTEGGRQQHRPDAEEFRALLTSLGWSGNGWLVVDPVPAAEQSFFQVLREAETGYRTEIRDGADRHFAALIETPEGVDSLMAAWTRGDGSWLTAQAWQPAAELNSEVDVPADIATAVADEAQGLIAGGFRDQFGVARALVDVFSESGGRLRVVHQQAERIVAQAWQARLAEQAGWPEKTDPDAIEAAFGALAQQGIVARADFTCCGSCGHAEIGAEAEPGSVGYVFFHQQSTEGVVAQGKLYLQYGAWGPDREQDTIVGGRVADAVTAAGLPVEWDGSGGSSVVVGPITWLKRLPASAV